MRMRRIKKEHCSYHLLNTFSVPDTFDLHEFSPSIRSWYDLYFYFIEVETEAWRTELTRLRSHSWPVAEPGS